MRKIISSILLLFTVYTGIGQITSPIIKANFGVDADLRANYFNGGLQAGNDDWYNYPGTAGSGEFVIDTTGAAGIVSRYATDVPFRKSSFFRTMRFPAYSIINNRVLLDAILVRDYHGDDSTVFASGSNKNGDNPLNWSTPVSQGIPDKNDILDMLVHIRRAGPNGTDSLWMFGGLSLDNTTGNRYFDFEMFQTDLYYNRSALAFGGAGPDAGHTSWEFNAAGEIIKAGDIIFSAEYQSSSLSNIEARIWVNKTTTSITPASFVWGGQFDGASAGATYGYASILPKTGGTYYTGLQCGNNTWGGPFAIILQDNSIQTDYVSKQYVEFSVNLSKLGLDPITRLGGDPCGMPFKSILVKTRASASFTAELKDFVAPFVFFNTPEAQIETETPIICKTGSIAEIHVTNPLSTSTYQWSTTNGHIVGSTTGQSIVVDTPGVYIVTQYLLTGCAPYATDTIEIQAFPNCDVLPASFYQVNGTALNNAAIIRWQVLNNRDAEYFIIERSADGRTFIPAGELRNDQQHQEIGNFMYTDPLPGEHGDYIFYRIRLVHPEGSFRYSQVIRLGLEKQKTLISLYPNPARDIMHISIRTDKNMPVDIAVYDPSGKRVVNCSRYALAGDNLFTLTEMTGKSAGMYMVLIQAGEEVYRQKFILVR